MGQTGRRQADCSRVVGEQQQKSDRRQWHAATGGRREDWVDERSRPGRFVGRSATDRALRSSDQILLNLSTYVSLHTSYHQFTILNGLTQFSLQN